MKVQIGLKALTRLMMYTLIADSEIGGLGTVEISDEAILIRDIFLVEQEAGQTWTVYNPSDTTSLMISLIEQGIDIGDVKLWWHSHCNEPVFWSSVDERTIKGFQADLLCSLVTNKMGKIRARFDDFTSSQRTADEVDLEVLPSPGEAVDWGTLYTEIAAEVKAKVRERGNRNG